MKSYQAVHGKGTSTGMTQLFFRNQSEVKERDRTVVPQQGPLSKQYQGLNSEMNIPKQGPRLLSHHGQCAAGAGPTQIPFSALFQPSRPSRIPSMHLLTSPKPKDLGQGPERLRRWRTSAPVG